MREIPVGHGKNTLVDDADFAWLSKKKWYYSVGGSVACNLVKVDGKQVAGTRLMHRIIMGSPVGMQIDHIDGNRLNNQRSNLRICTEKQNHYNLPAYRANPHGLKGVSYDVSRNKWRAYIVRNKQQIQLGRFNDKRMAVIAYNRAAKKIFGSYARTIEF